jgi:hypothetical protein
MEEIKTYPEELGTECKAGLQSEIDVGGAD